MIATSFTLRSPCSWKLQCEMYVLQFYLNPFSVVLAQLRLTLPCRCIDASTSTLPHLSTLTSSHAHIRRSTSPPHHTHTSAHLYHICTSTLSLLHICPVFLSFYISFLSSLCIYIFARSHPQICLSASIHLQIYIAPAHHSVTPSHPPSLSLFLYILSTVLDNYMSRSRANRRLVSLGQHQYCQNCNVYQVDDWNGGNHLLGTSSQPAASRNNAVYASLNLAV